jgi:error-prone DNA polymerase
VLRKTLGIPLFQEQVMKLAMVAADYTPGEADQLRRDMAAWRRSGRIEKHGEKLISRMIAKGIRKEFAERVFDQIRGFGEYGFPESHAASFALIGYCTAWLKHHYPVEFTCALLNAWPMGFYSPATIVEDAKRHGIQILPIHALKSQWECTLERTEEARKPHPFALRMGLRYVKGLGEGDWEKVQEARSRESRRGGDADGGLSLRTFIEASRLDEGALASLAESGALSCFGILRREALWEVSGIRRERSAQIASQSVSQASLSMDGKQKTPLFPSLDQLECLTWDYLSTGLSTEAHPLEPYREELAERGLPDAQKLIAMPDGSKVSYAGLVICRQHPGTANGVTFMTLEDESGFVNLIVWGTVFNKFRTLILTSALLGITGKIQAKDNVVNVIVETCWKPKLSSRPVSAGSRDFH